MNLIEKAAELGYCFETFIRIAIINLSTRGDGLLDSFQGYVLLCTLGKVGIRHYRIQKVHLKKSLVLLR